MMSNTTAQQGRFLSYVILAMMFLANVATAEQIFGTGDDDYYVCVCNDVMTCKQMVAIQCADTCFENADNEAGHHAYDVQCLEMFMDDTSDFMCGITLLEYDQILGDLSTAQTCL